MKIKTSLFVFAMIVLIMFSGCRPSRSASEQEGTEEPSESQTEMSQEREIIPAQTDEHDETSEITIDEEPKWWDDVPLIRGDEQVWHYNNSDIIATLAGSVLTISGTGAVAGNYFDGAYPWNDPDFTIFSVIIEEGIREIAYGAFSDKTLFSITIGSNLELGFSEGIFAFNHAFDNAYITNRKIGGTYVLEYGHWILLGHEMVNDRVVRLFSPDTNAEGFDVIENGTDGTPEHIVMLLVYYGILPRGVEINSFTIDDRNAHADMNAFFGYAVRTAGGSTAEMFLVYCLVNTLISFYNLESITLTSEGEVIETGHFVFDEPIEFWDGY